MHRYLQILSIEKVQCGHLLTLRNQLMGIQQKKSHYLLILYSTLWHQTISPQFKCFLSFRKKKERTCGVAVIYRICLGVIPLWMFCIDWVYIVFMTNISILCEGLCESTDEGQGKRMCMPLTIIPNTATYLPTLSSLPISFI